MLLSCSLPAYSKRTPSQRPLLLTLLLLLLLVLLLPNPLELLLLLLPNSLEVAGPRAHTVRLLGTGSDEQVDPQFPQHS